MKILTLKPVSPLRSVPHVYDNKARNAPPKPRQTPAKGRGRTDIVFKYPQLLGNCKFAWGKSPKYTVIPKNRLNLVATSAPPVILPDGTKFLRLRERAPKPLSEQDLPPKIGSRSERRLTLREMLFVRSQYEEDSAKFTPLRLSLLHGIPIPFVYKCLRASAAKG